MRLRSLLHTKRPFPASLCAHTNFAPLFRASLGKAEFCNTVQLKKKKKKSSIFFALSQEKVVALWDICFRALYLF